MAEATLAVVPCHFVPPTVRTSHAPIPSLPGLLDSLPVLPVAVSPYVVEDHLPLTPKAVRVHWPFPVVPDSLPPAQLPFLAIVTCVASMATRLPTALAIAHNPWKLAL